MNKFKKGEIVKFEDYSVEKERDIIRKGIVRFRAKDGQYYINKMTFDKGYEYLGCQYEWYEEKYLIKFNGEIVSEMRIDRATRIDTKEYYPKRKLWKLSDFESIEEVDKYCECDKSKKMCNCIVPTFKVKVKDEEVLIYHYDAELISEVTGIETNMKKVGLMVWC